MSALASGMAAEILQSGLRLSDRDGLTFYLHGLRLPDGSSRFTQREVAANIDLAITIARRRAAA